MAKIYQDPAQPPPSALYNWMNASVRSVRVEIFVADYLRRDVAGADDAVVAQRAILRPAIERLIARRRCIGDRLESMRHYKVISDSMIMRLNKVSEPVLKAGLLGSNEAGLFRPNQD